MNEVRSTLNVSTTSKTVVSTAVATTIYSFTVPGGSLDTDNSLVWEMQGEIGFNGNDTLNLYMVYGGETVSACQVISGLTTTITGKALLVDARLSADDSVDSQNGFIRSFLGVPASQDSSVPLGYGSIGVGSNGDQLLEIWAKWGSSSGNNTVTHDYSSLELLGFSEVAALPDLDEPTAQILISSKLTKLNYTTRKKIKFYAPLEHELTLFGYGEATFTRASTSTATWRDGASHTIAANKPRFEYSGDNPQGMAINTGTETLSFDVRNDLSGLTNTVIWVQNGVFKSTPTDSSIINTSGSYIGSSGVHISHLIGADQVLTAAEIAEIATLLV